MRKKRGLYITASLVVLLLLPALASADMYYEQTTYEEFLSGVGGQRLSKETHQRITVKGLMMKIDQVESNTSLLIRLDKRNIWELDHRKKTYTETPFHEVEMEKGVQDIRGQQLAPQMEAGMKAAQVGMLEATSGMPGDRKDFMRKMMVQQMRKMGTIQKTGSSGAKITTKKLSKEKIINGYKCQRYKILENDTPIVDMWATDKITPANNFVDFFTSINIYKPSVANAIRKIKGMPVKIRYVETFDLIRKVQYIKEVTKIQIKAVSDKEFDLPKSYKKHDKVSNDSF